MKLDLTAKQKEALEKIGISSYETDDIETVLMRMAQIIFELGEKR